MIATRLHSLQPKPDLLKCLYFYTGATPDVSVSLTVNPSPARFQQPVMQFQQPLMQFQQPVMVQQPASPAAAAAVAGNAFAIAGQLPANPAPWPMQHQARNLNTSEIIHAAHRDHMEQERIRRRFNRRYVRKLRQQMSVLMRETEDMANEQDDVMDFLVGLS
ncbi:MAG: uncharacterized protein KVP18_002398 [Porospora cf. gigantea A]|uniref:uncharacterized protein n=1 Tax=Porospora cf. gigantea A TaxID=2853593 RepID=UPI00355ACDA8|nr:MAG: hypothetical protein KVP18_002398 [Porospora cf. gigantea A]